MIERRDVISENHPAMDGHFPGKPTPPAVLLIQRVARVLEEEAGGRMRGVSRVRFRAALKPSVPFIVRAEKPCDGRSAFSVIQDEETIMTGIALTA